jgi:hypothetical protein
MRRFKNFSVLLFFVVLSLGLEARAGVEERLRASLEQGVRRACEVEECAVGAIERREVAEGVAEYSFPVRVGPGAHEVVVLHRVVREQAPWEPVVAPLSVFLVHGDAWGFQAAFLADVGSGAAGPEQSFAVYLAQQGVDVWGIDLRWVGVPEGTSDFGFMRGWTLGTHARDVGTGLAVARWARLLTGSGHGRMNLLGWSRGALVAYAYMNAEAQWPRPLRQVSGLIPVDMVLEFAPEDEAQRQGACVRYELARGMLENGMYEGGALGPRTGEKIRWLGVLAVAAPDAISSLPLPPGLPPLTNRQAALLAGAATHGLSALPPVVPGYHLVAGQFDVSPLPGGLAWTSTERYFDFLQRAAPFQSLTEIVESEALLCNEVDLPYDDHLQEVTVPVLYVGAAGGYGHHGAHSLSLLGSRDKTVHVVHRLPAPYRALDYGHADLFLADDAQEAVWKPILEWMRRH